MKGGKNCSDWAEARLTDALACTERGEVAVLPFLTPRERSITKRLLEQWGLRESAWFWGGYPNAERVCLFLLPWHLTAGLGCLPEESDFECMSALLGRELSESVSAVRISGSGYRSLSHRDFLGSVLGLGIERDSLGDLAVQNAREAVLFCSSVMANFLVEHLEKVSNDKVRCQPYMVDASFTDGRVEQPLRETIASPRLDCIVAALTGLSRENAQAAIKNGFVEVEYEVEERVDRCPPVPCTLTVRGFGKYFLRAFDGETKRGRLRLVAAKWV